MCKAFSCIITKSKKVYWKAGVDPHDELQSQFVKKDPELRDDKLPPNNTFARVEITPKDGDYLKPEQEWSLRVDEQVKPTWWDDSFEKPCMEAYQEWRKKIYSKIKLEEARNPIHPFKIKPPKKITRKHLRLLREWASVRNSVWASVGASVRNSVRNSVGDSVGASVRNSVGDSVWASVRASVWASVWDSVWAYNGSLFKGIRRWYFVDKKKTPFNKIKGYPFRSAVQLWRLGLVPSYSYYDKKWRLRGGPNAKILWEGTDKELQNL